MRSKLKAAGAVLTLVIAFGTVGAMDKQDAERQERQIQEDELFWDCTTSGDYQCGEPITNYPAPDAIR